MERFKRTDRLNHQFKEEISTLIQRELKDPRIGFCTITRVNISSDLKFAKIYTSVMGDHEQKAASIEGLSRAAGFIRKRLGDVLTIRSLPELHFILDENIEYAMHINELIAGINRAMPAPSPETESTPAEDSEPAQ